MFKEGADSGSIIVNTDEKISSIQTIVNKPTIVNSNVYFSSSTNSIPFSQETSRNFVANWFPNWFPRWFPSWFRNWFTTWCTYWYPYWFSGWFTRTPFGILRAKLQELYQNYTLPKDASITGGDPLLFEDYYVELQLSGYGKLLEIESVFDRENNTKSSRIFIEGKPGFGKTTMATKLAYDWAMRKKYMNFQLVFLVPLIQVQGQTVMDIIIKMGLRCGIEKNEIIKIMSDNEKDILLILDGLDKVPIESRQHVLDVLYGRQYSEVNFVVFATENSFKLTEIESMELFGVRHAKGEFYNKRLSILGIQSVAKKKQFLSKFMSPSAVNNVIKDLAPQMKLFDSPLFLTLLPIIMNNDKNTVRLTCKTYCMLDVFSKKHYGTRNYKRLAN